MSPRKLAGFFLRGFMIVACLAEAAGAAPAKRLVFDVFRGDDRIGSHVTVITTDGSRTLVDTHTSVDVKVLFFDAYHYEFAAQETLAGGAFASFVSTTDDNGTHHQLAVRRKDSAVEIVADGKTVPATPGVVPGSFWNEGLMRSGTVVMIETGALMKVVVKKLGEEKDAAGRKLEHYRVSGDIEREIWFRDGSPVRYRLVARDGSIIESRAR